MARQLLFTISTYTYMEPRFLEVGDFDHGHIVHKTFPDGERYLRVADDPWGRDVVLLGGTPNDLDWLELYDLGCAISRGGARSLSILMPYFGYATMERAVLPGEVVTAKTRARLVSAIPPCEGGTRVYLFDLHTDGIPFYFGDSHVTHHLYGAAAITDILQKKMAGRDYILGATDAGRAKWVQSLAQDLKVEPAFVYKKRDSETGKLAITGVNADVRGREVVIYDDMIRTGSSLIQAAKAYLSAGATKCHAIASHLILPPGALDKLNNSGLFEHILGTDSHPGSQQLANVPGAITPVASVFVNAMDRTHRV